MFYAVETDKISCCYIERITVITTLTYLKKIYETFKCQCLLTESASQTGNNYWEFWKSPHLYNVSKYKYYLVYKHINSSTDWLAVYTAQNTYTYIFIYVDLVLTNVTSSNNIHEWVLGSEPTALTLLPRLRKSHLRNNFLAR